MMGFTFLNPWILLGFLALPALYLLLRITPPAPKIIVLPTTRFLKDLIPDKQTTSHTPWWLLLLRLVMAGLLLLAMAHPVLNPATSLPGSGNIRIVIDNDWASIQTWNMQIKAAQEILAGAEREGRSAIIVTTTPAAGQEKPYISELMSAAKAKSALRAIEPLPWPTDYNAVASALKEKKTENIQSFWFSNGLDADGFQNLANTLNAQGNLTFYTPPSEKLPAALIKDEQGLNLSFPSETPKARDFVIQALDENGKVIDQQTLNKNTKLKIDTTNIPQGKLAAYQITGQTGAGGLYIIDDLSRKRSVGIVGPTDENTASKPFIEERYYLTRALEPYATLHLGSIDKLLKENLSVIILPDNAGNPESLSALEEWVKDGGTLLRFSGPQMAESGNRDFLTPVPLRLSSRSMSGALTWDKPQKLKEFSQTGPLADIAVPAEVTINTQILAEPSERLDEKTWARLEDGTPLITGGKLDRGLIVLIHTTASPLWSDLALSGTYVEILRHIIALSGHAQNIRMPENGTLQPLWVLDGYGRRQEPNANIRPIQASEFADAKISSAHPPGMYGIGSLQKALNLGDQIQNLQTPSGITHTSYGETTENDLMPYFLLAALALLLLDWVIMIMLYGNLKMPRSLALIALILLCATPAHADDKQDITYADGLYMAYIKSGDAAVDNITQKGLENLAQTLTLRTSVEPEGVIALDLNNDKLIFFPFIYWPVTAQTSALTLANLQKIQDYLDHGGTILLDTRDGGQSTSGLLRDLIGTLNVPPLHPIPEDHSLKRSFYLLSDFPGRYNSGTFWVEEKSVSGRDGVSSILIGANDWASAWAMANPTGTDMQSELSLRFGVNLMIYALTGNYKADQIHLPHILERLGQ